MEEVVQDRGVLEPKPNQVDNELALHLSEDEPEECTRCRVTVK